MAPYSRKRVSEFFQKSNEASTMLEKGQALENLICYVFQKVPGVIVTRRNEMNAFGTEEIDVAFWNEKHPGGFYFLPHIIIAECKNWSKPVGSQEVGYFNQRLQNRGLDYGILIAANGITGSGPELKRAHYEITMALSRGLHIIILTIEEIQALSTTRDLVRLLKEKLCELAVSGTIKRASR